jgi:hypothetical protein
MTEYLIEFHRIGAYVKVTAVDPQSGTEASIVGDAKTPQKHLEQMAVKRLLWVMNKEG